MTVSTDTEAMINARIAQIDHLISMQLNEVLHHPSFQKLEGTWRGLKYLLDQSETSDKLKIRVLNASKKELLRDLQRAPEFDQSALFKKVYEEEFGVFGGAPFAALVGRLRIRHADPEDIELLEKISKVAAAAHAPFLTAATSGDVQPGQLHATSTRRATWRRSSTPPSTPSGRASAQSEDSRYVGLALPHMLMRLPYGKDDASRWRRSTTKKAWTARTTRKYLWGNAAYALGARLTNAFAQYGWCAAIRGVEGGGLVEGLPAHNFTTDEGDIALKCPTEVADHGPAREGTGGPGLRSAGALQGHRLRGVLQRAVGAEGQDVRQGCGQRQRAALRAVAVHPGGVALRALPEVDDARQDRQLHVADGVRGVPEQVDHAVRDRRRQRAAR